MHDQHVRNQRTQEEHEGFFAMRDALDAAEEYDVLFLTEGDTVERYIALEHEEYGYLILRSLE